MTYSLLTIVTSGLAASALFMLCLAGLWHRSGRHPGLRDFMISEVMIFASMLFYGLFLPVRNPIGLGLAAGLAIGATFLRVNGLRRLAGRPPAYAMLVFCSATAAMLAFYFSAIRLSDDFRSVAMAVFVLIGCTLCVMEAPHLRAGRKARLMIGGGFAILAYAFGHRIWLVLFELPSESIIEATPQHALLVAARTASALLVLSGLWLGKRFDLPPAPDERPADAEQPLEIRT